MAVLDHEASVGDENSDAISTIRCLKVVGAVQTTAECLAISMVEPALFEVAKVSQNAALKDADISIGDGALSRRRSSESDGPKAQSSKT